MKIYGEGRVLTADLPFSVRGFDATCRHKKYGMFWISYRHDAMCATLGQNPKDVSLCFCIDGFPVFNYAALAAIDNASGKRDVFYTDLTSEERIQMMMLLERCA